MSSQRSLLLGTLGALAWAAGCSRILGIEDAECDPAYSSDCLSEQRSNGGSTSTPIQTFGLNPQSAGSAGAVASAGAGGSGGAGASGGAGGSSNTAGAAGSSMVASAGAAGSGSMMIDPIVARASQLCLDYCDTVATACTEKNQQYATQFACLAVCEQLPAGNPGATSGNSVQCRLGLADQALRTGEPSNYCFAAGPGGANVCGSDCEGFCTMMTQKCTQMGTFDQCLTSCRLVPDLSQAPTNVRYDSSQQSGNSLQCRLFHVSAASVDPVGHCVHAAGQSPCSN
jgi:hypothetical protein